jgi:hypothetical protein
MFMSLMHKTNIHGHLQRIQGLYKLSNEKHLSKTIQNSNRKTYSD